MDISAIKSAASQTFQGRGVEFALLFGSVAKGTDRPDSDIDIAVMLSEPTAKNAELIAAELASELERCLGASVDIVILNTARPRLVGRISLDGEPIFETDEIARCRYVARQRKIYLDFMEFAGPLDKEILRLTAEGRR